jgi:hypothetical protein
VLDPNGVERVVTWVADVDLDAAVWEPASN